MDYEAELASLKTHLLEQIDSVDEPRGVLRSKELRGFYAKVKEVDQSERASFGQAVNTLKNELEQKIIEKEAVASAEKLETIDVTAPFDVNVPHDKKPRLLPAEQGSIHPVNSELKRILGIFNAMGFSVLESRQLDDDYHMFTSLNFPDDHPARDDYDTFMTTEGLIAPAHTSVMQNRILKSKAAELEKGEQIAYVIPGRVFRNEDLDPRHEHTFHQLEGIFVGRGITVGDLTGTFKSFLESYYQRELSVRVNPFYFPFTEPSLEFALSCPFCESGCSVCSYEGWIELLGMGMIHPNVLRDGGVDPEKFTGFAWGMGVERLVMMKNGIEDVRLFNSGKLDFLKQFGAAR